MTDEELSISDATLIARLRDADHARFEPHLHHAAADRIEALVKERDEAWKRAARAEKMWGEAEIKLAKAVAAAEEMSAAFYSNGNVTDRHLRACKAGVKLDATLAEIKGESHE